MGEERRGWGWGWGGVGWGECVIQRFEHCNVSV